MLSFLFERNWVGETLGEFETKIMGLLSKIKSQEVEDKDIMKAKYVCGGSVKKWKICAMTAEFWKLFKNHDDWAPPQTR